MSQKIKFTLIINDNLHKKIIKDAIHNKRSIGKQYEWILGKYYE